MLNMSSQRSSSVQDKELTPLQESLYVLVALNNRIKKALTAMVSKDHMKDEDLKFTITNHIHILLCAFLDEWRKLEALGSETQIKNTLKITSPAIGRIRQWKGLPKVRSILLAHGHRDKDGVAALPWDVFGKYDAPTAYAETILLGNCVLLAVAVVIDRHRADYQEVFNQLSSKKRYIEDKGIKTIEEIDEELRKIKKNMLVELSKVGGVPIDILREDS
jgi:hypothetical protein